MKQNPKNWVKSFVVLTSVFCVIALAFETGLEKTSTYCGALSMQSSEPLFSYKGNTTKRYVSMRKSDNNRICILNDTTLPNSQLFMTDFNFTPGANPSNVTNPSNVSTKKPQTNERSPMTNSNLKETSSTSMSSNSRASQPQGLFCYNVLDCYSCLGIGKVQPRFTAPMVTVACTKCQGIDINILYLQPCSKCNNSRKVKVVDPNFTPPSKVTCQSCDGNGYTKGARFEVAHSDHARQVTYDQAVLSSNSMTNGWRLPTTKELKGMYKFLHKNGQGNFYGTYWGLTEVDYGSTDANTYNFNSGFSGSNLFHSLNNVRLVRSVP